MDKFGCIFNNNIIIYNIYIVERGPNKKRIIPHPTKGLVNVDDIFEGSSSDSNVHVKDFNVNSQSNSDETSSLSFSKGSYFLV